MATPSAAQPLVAAAAPTTAPASVVASSPTDVTDPATVQEHAATLVRRVRVTYGLLLVIGFIIGELMQNNVVQWMTHWKIADAACGTPECIAAQGVYRVSFALFLFFLIHYVMSSSWNLCMSASQRVAFNSSYILVKVALLIPVFVICFLIPNDFFVVFAWLSVVLSCLFLIGQQIVLLEFAYSWSDSWSTKGDDGDNKFYVGLLVCTVVMNLASLTFIGLMYHWFAADTVCQLSQAMVTITLIAGIVFTALSIYSPTGSVLPSATVFLYTTWTCFSALTSSPPGQCNSMSSTDSGTWQTVIGAVFSCVSLVYCSVNAATSRDAFILDSDEATTQTEEEAESSCFSFFHGQMMLGSCYLAMLLTNWTVTGSDKMAQLVGTTAGAQWAKFGSELTCIAFYVWTLVAPILFPSRFAKQ